MAKREKKVPLTLAECQRQLEVFNMVIGNYDINHTVKEATEIINNYEQAHTDDQVMIHTMDGMITQLQLDKAKLVDLIQEVMDDLPPDLRAVCDNTLKEMK
jgi:hypothetical protein